MTNRVTGVRSVELGVRDLHQSAEFYTKVWALEQVGAESECMHFRATGGEHRRGAGLEYLASLAIHSGVLLEAGTP